MDNRKIFFAQNIMNPSITGGYGRLYNWYAISNPLFAPINWKVPSIADFQTLSTYLGGNSISGGHLKESGLIHWNTPNFGADNSSGFTSIGAGSRDSSGAFVNLKIQNALGVKEEYTSTTYQAMTTSYLNGSVGGFIGGFSKRVGTSIRLIYDVPGIPAPIIDEDGYIYDVVLIGTQYWTVQNWKCTKLNDGTPLTNVTDVGIWGGLTSEGYCAYDNLESNV